MKKTSPKRFTLTTRRYIFQPRWSLTFLTLAVLICFLKLGFWQLDRAKEKEFLKQRFEAGLQAMPIAISALPSHLPSCFYLPVTATGYYDNAHSILLDNKIHNHQVGYEVLTPLHIEYPSNLKELGRRQQDESPQHSGSYVRMTNPVENNPRTSKEMGIGEKRTVLVNRGWIPAPQSRHVLPDIPHISGKQKVTGLIYLPPEKPFTLEKKGAATTVTWPYRVQILDITHIKKVLHTPLYPFVVQLDAKQDHGFVRDWQPVNLSPDKHLGYAVQWFTFAGVLIIIFIALNISYRPSS